MNPEGATPNARTRTGWVSTAYSLNSPGGFTLREHMATLQGPPLLRDGSPGRVIRVFSSAYISKLLSTSCGTPANPLLRRPVRTRNRHPRVAGALLSGVVDRGAPVGGFNWIPSSPRFSCLSTPIRPQASHAPASGQVAGAEMRQRVTAPLNPTIMRTRTAPSPSTQLVLGRPSQCIPGRHRVRRTTFLYAHIWVRV